MKMNSKYILFLLVSLLLGSTACNDSEFLTENNPNDFTAAAFWKTKEHAVAGVMSAYGALQFGNVMGGNASTSLMVMTDMVKPNPWNSGAKALNDFSFNESSGFVRDAWKDLYVGVFRANQVLANVPDIAMEEVDKEQILGEAYFLRGLFNFWLATMYNDGEIVLHTEVPSIDNVEKGLSSREDVYAAIISDFENAKAMLPEKWPAEQTGRATWGAATALLGKVHLYEENWAQAAANFKEVIDRPDLYQLTDDISDNFSLEGEFNSESIFEVAFSDAAKPGASGYTVDGPNGSESTTRPRIIAPGFGGGWRVQVPTLWAIQLYKDDPIDPADPRNVGRTYSLRAVASVTFKGDDLTYYTKENAEINWESSNLQTEGYIRKFQNWEWESEDKTLTRSGINERIIRLADVYLMYAEAVLEKDGDVATAIDYINMVRKRSAVLPLEASDFNKESLMTHLIKVERALELAFEGHNIRFNDIRRKGIGKALFTEISQIDFDLNGAVVKDFELAAQNYGPEKEYFPIPNSEVLANENLQGNGGE
ncbi:RagB/SusD family nutrient uptake outer membrane protein [Flammeovirgaceae bacterium SG7u.111]|nr:RagB/SusD family nutrient uptake outer membrane protein [Flammeovirgaceae bacterium SG7u.132]WPO37598.1 RagB/SusD family nutrient uptake outer membrane protein [Flammeovirgaceae bacterium SG7u.111]